MKDGHESNRVTSGLVNQEIGKILSERIVLTELRKGNTVAAMESLEFSIDAGICIIWHRLESLDAPTRASALEALRIIGDYRTRFPRKDDPHSGPALESHSRGDQEISQEATRILETIKTGSSLKGPGKGSPNKAGISP